MPEGLNYDLWLGPAPEAPFTPARVFRTAGFPGWYFISDYSKAGWIAGYGVHDLDIAQWGMGMERTGPVAIEGRGEYPRDGLFDTILTYRIEFTYANGVKIIMTDTGQNRHGVTFVGEEGRVFTRGELEAEPKSLLRESFGPDDIHLYRSPDHARNFIDCVRSRGETITPAEIAHQADRLDVTEECVRLRAHLDHFRGFAAEESSAGRKLNFLLQEMNREATTIGSKANDAQVAQWIVEAKTHVERLREQAANVE